MPLRSKIEGGVSFQVFALPSMRSLHRDRIDIATVRETGTSGFSMQTMQYHAFSYCEIRVRDVVGDL
jgi:hypothetical protein